MKRLVCYIIGDAEIIRLMLRELGLELIGKRSVDSAVGNIKWLTQIGKGFEYMMKKCKDIPCEIFLEHIGFLHKCIYEED